MDEAQQQQENIFTIKDALTFLDAPSDLVPGVYEGGLKTWECSLDFVEYIDGLKESPELKSFQGKKILEVRYVSFKFLFDVGLIFNILDWLWNWCAIDVHPSRIPFFMHQNAVIIVKNGDSPARL